MRVFALRAVLMLTAAILGTSALSAGMALGVSGSDASYMLIVCTVCTLLLCAALWLTRGFHDPGSDATAAPTLDHVAPGTGPDGNS